MSTDSEIQPTPETPTPETAAPAEETVFLSETDIAVEQLRALVCGLVVGLFLSSAAFTLYIFKETRTLKYQIASRQAQLKQSQDFLKAAMPAVNDLAKYSVSKPELMAVFARYGLKIGQNVAPTQPAPSAPGFQPMP